MVTLNYSNKFEGRRLNRYTGKTPLRGKAETSLYQIRKKAAFLKVTAKS
jgi:hypothetical protein